MELYRQARLKQEYQYKKRKGRNLSKELFLLTYFLHKLTYLGRSVLFKINFAGVAL